MNEKTEQKNTSPAKSGQTAAKDATATSQAKATTKPSKKRLKVFAVVLGLGLIAGVGLCVNFMWVSGRSAAPSCKRLIRLYYPLIS